MLNLLLRSTLGKEHRKGLLGSVPHVHLAQLIKGMCTLTSPGQDNVNLNLFTPPSPTRPYHGLVLRLRHLQK
jgi:hypothetical protein